MQLIRYSFYWRWQIVLKFCRDNIFEIRLCQSLTVVCNICRETEIAGTNCVCINFEPSSFSGVGWTRDWAFQVSTSQGGFFTGKECVIQESKVLFSDVVFCVVRNESSYRYRLEITSEKTIHETLKTKSSRFTIYGIRDRAYYTANPISNTQCFDVWTPSTQWCVYLFTTHKKHPLRIF